MLSNVIDMRIVLELGPPQTDATGFDNFRLLIPEPSAIATVFIGLTLLLPFANRRRHATPLRFLGQQKDYENMG